MATESTPAPEQMRAVVLRDVGEWGVESVPTPSLTAVENVLVRIEAAAICGSDPKMMHGRLPWPPEYPFVPGHEYAGEVVAVGEGVDRLAPGDRVFGETHSGCGTCRACRRGQYQLCENFGDDETGHRQIGHTLDGAFAEYAAVPADLLHPLSDDVGFAEGALLDTNAIALNCSERGGIRAGDTVVVLGTGIIGLCCVQHAAALGASHVVATGNPRNADLAAELGADDTVDYRDDVVDRVRDLTDGRWADVTLEAVGVDETMRQAVEVTRAGGTVSVDGMPVESTQPVPTQEIVKKQLDFRGCRAHANLAEASERLVRSGAVRLEPLVGAEYPLAAFDEAYEAFTGEERHVRVVLRPDRPATPTH